MPSESMVTVPASFVDLLRETVVTQLTDCAIEISDSGRAHPEGIEECLFAPFERYCALLRCVGCVPTVPAAAVKVALAEHRWALVAALRCGLDFERWMAEQGDPAFPSGAEQRREAQRRARQIERFLAAAGLGDVPSPDLSVEAMLARHGERELTPEEFERHFGHLPTDGEG
jgi:hypothetical protein